MNKNNILSLHLLTLLAFGLVAHSNYSLIKEREQRPNIDRILKVNFEVEGLDSRLVEAIIQVESSGRPDVVSNKGAIGLMQIVPRWHRDRCGLSDDTDLFKPDVNIRCGSKVLRHYLAKENNNLREALARYNGGYTRCKASYQYADKVLTLFTKL